VVRFEDIKRQPQSQFESMITEFYCVALKKNFNGKLKYGQNEFDFDEGVMHFMAPKQLLTIESPPGEPQETTGWLLHFHPDFLWKTTLARKIRQYEFFSYKVTEALHLSEKEETMIGGIMENIGQECRERIDNFSQSIIIAHI